MGQSALKLVDRESVVPLFLGWRVAVGEDRVDWRGGWQGPHTVVRQGSGARRHLGLLDEDMVREALRPSP
jgi:hypothetical protein